MTRPNILVILTDQQSAEAMSCAGNSFLSTPNLDRLADRGVRFDRNYCSSPVCVPWRSSFIYGRMPHEVLYPGTEEDMSGGKRSGEARGVRPEFAGQDLGSLLTSGGYDCAYAGKWHVGKWGPTESLPDGGRECGFRKLCNLNDQRVPIACADFLAEPRDRPFFLVASFDNPHNICEWRTEVPLPWGNLPAPPAPEELPPLPPNFAESAYEPVVVREERRKFAERYGYSAEDWRRYRWAYYRLVEKVDAQIGKLLDSLEETGRETDTLVLFTSDHGEMNGAHQLANKHLFYEESVRSPLVLSGPQVAGPGRCDARLVCNALDGYATILDYANVQAPQGIRGSSLRPILENDGHAKWRDHIISSCRFNIMPGQGRMVRSARFKYIVYQRGPRREQLFDLDADPGEMVNLATCAAYAQILRHHRELLRSWMIETGDTFGGGHYGHPDSRIALPGDELQKRRPAASPAQARVFNSSIQASDPR